jgi:hypothetical protein
MPAAASSTGEKCSAGGDIEVAGIVCATCGRGLTVRGAGKPARSVLCRQATREPG